jgi:hypothetical protein
MPGAGCRQEFLGRPRHSIERTTFGVDSENPIAHDLQTDAANAGRIRARAAGINPGQRQKTAGLTGSLITAKAYAVERRQSRGEAVQEQPWQTLWKLVAC